MERWAPSHQVFKKEEIIRIAVSYRPGFFTVLSHSA